MTRPKTRRTSIFAAAALLAGAAWLATRPPRAQGESFLDQAWKQEEAIAACMAGKGFYYVPWVNPSEDVALTEAAPVGSVEPNPNDAIVAAMTPEEAEAYAAAYWGTDSGPTGASSPLGDGCVAEATRAVFGEPPDLASHSRELADIADAVDNDPRVITAEAEWARCMAEAGFVAHTRRELYDELTRVESERSQNANPADPAVRQLEEFYDYRDSAMEQDATCAVDLIRIRDEVHNELLDQFWDRHPPIDSAR